MIESEQKVYWEFNTFIKVALFAVEVGGWTPQDKIIDRSADQHHLRGLDVLHFCTFYIFF